MYCVYTYIWHCIPPSLRRLGISIYSKYTYMYKCIHIYISASAELNSAGDTVDFILGIGTGSARAISRNDHL